MQNNDINRLNDIEKIPFRPSQDENISKPICKYPCPITGISYDSLGLLGRSIFKQVLYRFYRNMHRPDMHRAYFALVVEAKDKAIKAGTPARALDAISNRNFDTHIKNFYNLYTRVYDKVLSIDNRIPGGKHDGPEHIIENQAYQYRRLHKNSDQSPTYDQIDDNFINEEMKGLSNKESDPFYPFLYQRYGDYITIVRFNNNNNVEIWNPRIAVLAFIKGRNGGLKNSMEIIQPVFDELIVKLTNTNHTTIDQIIKGWNEKFDGRIFDDDLTEYLLNIKDKLLELVDKHPIVELLFPDKELTIADVYTIETLSYIYFAHLTYRHAGNTKFKYFTYVNKSNIYYEIYKNQIDLLPNIFDYGALTTYEDYHNFVRSDKTYGSEYLNSQVSFLGWNKEKLLNTLIDSGYVKKVRYIYKKAGKIPRTAYLFDRTYIDDQIANPNKHIGHYFPLIEDVKILEFNDDEHDSYDTRTGDANRNINNYHILAKKLEHQKKPQKIYWTSLKASLEILYRILLHPSYYLDWNNVLLTKSLEYNIVEFIFKTDFNRYLSSTDRNRNDLSYESMVKYILSILDRIKSKTTLGESLGDIYEEFIYQPGSISIPIESRYEYAPQLSAKYVRPAFHEIYNLCSRTNEPDFDISELYAYIIDSQLNSLFTRPIRTYRKDEICNALVRYIDDVLSQQTKI